MAVFIFRRWLKKRYKLKGGKQNALNPYVNEAGRLYP